MVSNQTTICSNLAGAPLAAGVFVPLDFSCSNVTRSADFAEDPDWKQFATRVEIDVQAQLYGEFVKLPQTSGI